jgi:hypothetical protein
MGHPDKIIVFSVLIISMILVCIYLDVSWEGLRLLLDSPRLICLLELLDLFKTSSNLKASDVIVGKSE